MAGQAQGSNNVTRNSINDINAILDNKVCKAVKKARNVRLFVSCAQLPPTLGSCPLQQAGDIPPSDFEDLLHLKTQVGVQVPLVGGIASESGHVACRPTSVVAENNIPPGYPCIIAAFEVGISTVTGGGEVIP